MCIVKFVIDSIQKNNGINISLLLDIYIEKSSEKAFWEMIIVTNECVELFDFFKNLI